MTPQQFIAKWQRATLSERSACQQHFLDLCELLGQPKPAEADPEGTWYTFEKGVESPFVGYAIQAYDRAFVLLESALSHDQPWILGQELTLADVNLIPYVARLHFLDLLNVWLEDQAHIKKWWTRVQGLPQFHQSILQPMKAIEIQEMQHYGQLIAPQIKARLEAFRTGVKF